MQISITIPAYNEGENNCKLVSYLAQQQNEPLAEIIVADAGNTGETIKVAEESGVKVVVSPQKGWAAQMNYIASLTKRDISYFTHPYTFPSSLFAEDIISSVKEGYSIGRYQTKFNSLTAMKTMEEYEFIKRGRQGIKYKILSKSTLVSARKYDPNSWWRVQSGNRKIVNIYKKRSAQEEIAGG